MWILVDVSNGGALEIQNAGKVYFWTFKTKDLATKFKRRVSRRKFGAELIGPFRFEQVTTLKKQTGLYNVLVRE
jgi:hypothetical protein